MINSPLLNKEGWVLDFNVMRDGCLFFEMSGFVRHIHSVVGNLGIGRVRHIHEINENEYEVGSYDIIWL